MLRELLECNKEEPIQKYLENNPQILVAVFGMPEWAYNIVIPKFQFGSDYSSDFVIITGQSYSYWIYLVELEPATEKLFTKNGDYARRLNHAIKQVDEWEDWINRNESYFKSSLLKAIKKIDSSFEETFDHTRRFIVSKNIIIGRRYMLTPDDNKRRAIERREKGIDIVTYDRLVECENKIIQRKKEGKRFSRFNYDD